MNNNNKDNNLSNSNSLIGGAKRKNGHKLNCTCHICDNIKNKVKRGGYEEDFKKKQLKSMGGSKKKNGHKPECICPICKNMKKCKSKKIKGGNLNDESSSDSDSYSDSDSDSDSDSSSSSSSSSNNTYLGGKNKKKVNKKKIKRFNRKGGDENKEIQLDKDEIKENTENEKEAKDEEYETLEDLGEGIRESVALIGGKKNKKVKFNKKSKVIKNKTRKTRKIIKKNRNKTKKYKSK